MAIDTGLEILAQLGEIFPTSPGPNHVKREYKRTCRILNTTSPERLLRLPVLKNKEKLAVIQIVNLLFSTAFLAQPFLAPLLVLRAMNITAEYGLCATSSYIVGAYAMLVCSYGGEIKKGTTFGDVALSLLERFKSREWLPRAYVALYGCVYGWTKDIRYCAEKLHWAEKIGFETGDNQSAALSVNIRTSYLFVAGEPLFNLQKDMETYADEMESLGQTKMLEMHTPFAFTISAFAESDGCTAVDFLSKAREESCRIDDNQTGIYWDCWLAFQTLLVAYLAGDSEFCVMQAEKCKLIETFPYNGVDIAVFYLFYSLSHLAHYKVSGKNRKKVVRLCRSRLRKIEALAKFNPQFCLGKAYLLQAELAAIGGKHDTAHRLYASACGMFSSEKLLMEFAVAKELMGRYMHSRGEIELAHQHLEGSVEIFKSWGAPGKASMIEREMGSWALQTKADPRKVV